MAERIEVDMIVKAIAKGFDKLVAEQKKTGKAAEAHEKKIGGLSKKMEALKKTMFAAGLAIVAFGVAAKKAFDLARSGAAIEQTRESFDRLIRSLGQGPELLEDLRKAARGTVDDMTLMSSVLTLVAGAGPELARGLLAATPRLLEIAKAANKLNPALGDTAFFFESIATGIKRAQPLILDNLGLTIKVGAANIAMAKELGKSVDALTAEEKAIAILNDTMRAGAVIIEQVGGSTEALTDEFDILTTNIKNATEAWKIAIKEGLLPIVTAYNENVAATTALNDALEIGIITQATFNSILAEWHLGLIDTATAMALLAPFQEEHAVQMQRIAERHGDARQKILLTREALELTGVSFRNMGAAATAGFNQVDLAIGKSIERTIDQLKFVAGGGAEVAKVVAEITAAVETGKIMPDDAIPLYEDAQELTLQIQQNTELITHKEAIETAKDWGIELQGPVSSVQTIRDDLAGLTSGEHVIRVRIEVEGGEGLGISGGGGGGGGGLQGTVPHPDAEEIMARISEDVLEARGSGAGFIGG